MLPDESFNKSQTVLKRDQKRPYRLIKGQKNQTLFVVLPFLYHRETYELQEYHKKFFQN